MEALFLKLLNMSFAASWLVLAVLVLRLVLLRAPKWTRGILWVLVALRLLCPLSIESALSLVPSVEPLPQEILYAAHPRLQTGIPALNTATAPVMESSFAPLTGNSVNPLQVYATLGAWLWLAGVVAMLLYALISYLRLRRRVATSLPLQDNILICDDIESPFILGVLRPRIFLPSSLAEPQLSHVLAHERAHLARHDHWWKPLGFLLLSVYWFNPLLWLSYVLLCRDIELACDEFVYRDMALSERADYSQALLDCSRSRRVIAACPLAFGEADVKGRVKAALHYRKPAFWIIVAAVLVCAVAAVCFLTNPVTSELCLKESVSEKENSHYTVSARLRRVEQGDLSPVLAESIKSDWAQWDELSESAKMTSNYLPSSLSWVFDSWDAAEDFLGYTVDNPLEGVSWIRPVNWSGWDAANSDDESWHKPVELSVQGDRGGVKFISLNAGYYDNETTRVQLTATLTCLRGLYETGAAWGEYMNFHVEWNNEMLTVFPRPLDAKSSYRYPLGTLWIVHEGVLYQFSVTCLNDTIADPDTAIRETLYRLRVAFSKEDY